MSSLVWVHAVCFHTLFVYIGRQIFAAEDFSRRHFQMHIFLGALRVNINYSEGGKINNSLSPGSAEI